MAQATVEIVEEEVRRAWPLQQAHYFDECHQRCRRKGERQLVDVLDQAASRLCLVTLCLPSHRHQAL
jgi:hypothetical protein